MTSMISPRKCAKRSTACRSNGIYCDASFWRELPKTMTNSVNTIATRKITVYTTAHIRSTSQFLVSSRSLTELSPSVMYCTPFAADQIATIAVMEIMPADLLYTSSISEIRNGAMYSGITLSMIFKSVPSVTEVYCNRDEKTIRNGISDNIIKNADCAEYALILSRLHFPINDITFPIIFQIIMSLFLPSLRLFPR